MDAIEAYLWATPNCNRVSILLEELRLAYRVHPIDIRAGAQRAARIQALNPYGKLPILTWREDGRERVLFESGAILIHLAEACGRLLPSAAAPRAETLAWLMVVLTGLGPFSGQAHHWTALDPERPESAIRHHVALVERIYRVLDERLARHEHLAGAYSIADIAAYPWIARCHWARMTLDDHPHLGRWFQAVGARPAVARGMDVPRGVRMD